jgi:small subunit ribosomal protein S4
MARYRGPRLKKCRAVGTVLPGLTTVGTLDRPFPPGEHGTKRKSKPSDYKIRLVEKQKARWHYGILEKQFRRYVSEASRMKGPAGTNLVLLLESRLDNLVWRLGFARTIVQARQLVVHGHILVNGKRVDRPSFHVAQGTEIAMRDKTKAKAWVAEILEQTAMMPKPSWLEFDPAKAAGKLLMKPERSDVPVDYNENAIIEFYSQQL